MDRSFIGCLLTGVLVGCFSSLPLFKTVLEPPFQPTRLAGGAALVAGQPGSGGLWGVSRSVWSDRLFFSSNGGLKIPEDRKSQPPAWSLFSAYLNDDRQLERLGVLEEWAWGWPFRATRVSAVSMSTAPLPTNGTPPPILATTWSIGVIPLGWVGNILAFAGFGAVCWYIWRTISSADLWGKRQAAAELAVQSDPACCLGCGYAMLGKIKPLRCPECGQVQVAPRRE